MAESVLQENFKKVMKIIKHRKATSDEELLSTLSKFGIHDVQILMRDEFLRYLQNAKNGDIVIANTKNYGVGHWVGYYKKNNKNYLYCSNGFDFENHFGNKSYKRDVRASSVQQKDRQNLCGHYAVAWILMIKRKDNLWKQV